MKVIFLDIDGVIQPYNSQSRFKHDLKALRKELSKKYNRDYSIYHSADVGACYYDWNEDAVNRIKKILKETGAKIVISSDWRSEELLDKMKDLLRIWNMDKYLVGETEAAFDGEKMTMQETCNYIEKKIKSDKFSYREIEILDYVYKHKEITNYVAIDDMNLSKTIGEHFVKTDNLIDDKQVDECIKILNNKNFEIR